MQKGIVMTQPPNQELLPCPFCGKVAVKINDRIYGDVVCCGDMSCAGRFLQVSAEKWNCRAPQQREISVVDLIRDNIPQNPVTEWGKGYAQACHDIYEGIENLQPMPVSINQVYHNEKLLDAVIGHDGTFYSLREIAQIVLDAAGVNYVD